jgi:hypothetical protein
MQLLQKLDLFVSNQRKNIVIKLPDEFIAAYEFFVRERSQTKVVSKGNSVFYLIPKETFESFS